MSLSSRLQRLLVATDLSVRAEHAFNRAVQLALQNNAKLTVLHVIPDELEPSFSEALKQQARKALDSLVAQAMAKGELQIEIAIKGGLDREQIMKQVAQAAAHGENHPSRCASSLAAFTTLSTKQRRRSTPIS